VKEAARLTPALLAHAIAAATEVLRFTGPADETLSRYFRSHRALGQNERAFVAEAVFAVLRRKRSLEAAAGSAEPRLLIAAALVRVLGFSGRSLAGLFDEDLIGRLRSASGEELPLAVRAELPDWLWSRLAGAQGEAEALRLAQALANPAPLDLRVNLARIGRDEALTRLQADGLEARATPYSPAGIRLNGRPPINRHPLFKEGLVEVQDEGSQLIAWLLAPRRGEMIADYCAGAGGKTLAAAALMRGTGRIYAFDTSPKRLAALAPRAARAGITNVHAVVLAAGQGRAVQRLRYPAAQSRAEMALRRAGDRRAGGEAGPDPRRGEPPGEARRAARLCHLQHPRAGKRGDRRGFRRRAAGIQACFLRKAA